ncbi:MAG: hypothetical protein H6605_09305 [Flavobacteriales bacterium]|nr:hypothetical protein [Flavobacteriales bacterium]
MTSNWIPILGSYTQKTNEIEFIGGTYTSNETSYANIANLLSDQVFSGGTIHAEILFKSTEFPSACEFIISWVPETQQFVSAGIGGSGGFASVRTFTTKWTNHSIVGDHSNLIANKTYRLEVELKGSTVTVRIDGVNSTTVNLPYNLPLSQVGIWCQSNKNISIKNFTVNRELPKAFVVMQFSSPYNELYDDVIKGVCNEFSLDVLRGDETYGTGLILSDITNQINESKLVIAEISALNPNVFYEVGYAHALNKPTILIADKITKLPFDVSPFRTLYYENSIAGKKKVEEGLRNHIDAVLSEKGII